MADHRLVFDRWSLDLQASVLVGESGVVELRPKSYEVLRHLVENAGRLVSRSEILDTVWPAVIVTEDSLTQCVSEIRSVLGDTGQRFIRTVPKRGYLFSASVTRETDRPAVTTTGPPASQTVAKAGEIGGSGAATPGPTICVLPLANLGGEAAEDYLGDGITEDLIDGLSHFRDLSVIARSSSFSYKGRAIDVRDIGRQLGVQYVVDGSVRRIGDRIRITAQLVDAQSGMQRWSDRFDRALGDIFAIQDEITRSIVRIVVAHLGKAESERAARKLPNSWTAYDLLIKGEQLLLSHEQSWQVDLFAQARACFLEARKSDPENARICANLGHTYSRAHTDPMMEDLGRLEVLAQGHELLKEAVGLDPNLPMARALLGWTLIWLREAEAGVEEFERAQEINPNFWDWRHANALIYAGRAQEAVDVVRVHQRLDPFHPPHVHAFQGHALFLLERYDEAVTPLRNSMRRGPRMLLAHVWLAATLVRLGQIGEARSLIAHVRERAPLMTLQRWRGPQLYLDPVHLQNMNEALREAGFA